MPSRSTSKISQWLYPDASGLYCAPGRFHIDPHASVEKAIVTHGHADHARPGHGAVLTSPETTEIMSVRLGDQAGRQRETLKFGEHRRIGDVDVSLAPAGHVLGSAQVVMTYHGMKAVVSGDYKRRADETCVPFEPVTCDVFVTEATFALPVFRHEPDDVEIARLLQSLATFPERTHLVGAYGLGKCQRLIRLLRAARYDRPIWLHGALIRLCALYEELGVALGPLLPVSEASPKSLEGEIVMAPPGALRDRWSRRLGDPVTVFASGWMRVRGRARQRGVELPLIISDHADWDELTTTIDETEAEEIWVTHGREDALVHHIEQSGRRGFALSLIGREDEDE